MPGMLLADASGMAAAGVDDDVVDDVVICFESLVRDIPNILFLMLSMAIAVAIAGGAGAVVPTPRCPWCRVVPLLVVVAAAPPRRARCRVVVAVVVASGRARRSVMPPFMVAAAAPRHPRRRHVIFLALFGAFLGARAVGRAPVAMRRVQEILVVLRRRVHLVTRRVVGDVVVFVYRRLRI